MKKKLLQTVRNNLESSEYIIDFFILKL